MIEWEYESAKDNGCYNNLCSSEMNYEKDEEMFYEEENANYEETDE